MKISERDLLQALPSLEELEQEEQRRHLPKFIRAAWESVEPGTDYDDNFHIQAICEHLTALFKGTITRLIINIPPRHMKSIISSVMFPAWIWLTDPSFKLITCSYSSDLAKRDSIRSRALFETKFYRGLNQENRAGDPIFRMYDARFADTKNLKNTEKWYQNNKGGQRIAVGVDGGATGEGGDLLSVDDPHNPKQANSEAHRINALEWWDQTMSTRLNDLRRGRKLIIMQRLHTQDLTGHELSKNLGYTHLRLAARFESRRRCVTVLGDRQWSDPREKDGEILCPNRFSDEDLTKLELSLGPFGTAGQMQQIPVPAGGGIFREEYCKSWRNLPMFDGEAISVDCAFKDTETSSYVVLQHWGWKGSTDYLLEQVRAHLDFNRTCEQLEGMCRRNPRAGAKLVEDKANGTAVINALAKKISGLIPISPQGSKEARAHAVSPFFAANNVLLPPQDLAPWIPEFLFELCNFPKAGTDDQVDATTQYLTWRHLSDNVVEEQQAEERFNRWAGLKIGV